MNTQPAPRATFAATLERLYAEQHTGPVIVHFAQGCPNTIEIPGEPTRIVLTKRPNDAHS